MRRAVFFGYLAAAGLFAGLTASVGSAGDARQAAPRYPQEAMIASSGVYSNCAACHGAAGEGGVGTALKGNAALADPELVVAIVLNGTARMPAFGGQFDNAQLAAVASAIRMSWGNNYGPVDVATAAQLRKRLTSAPSR